jgi:hypothetical protein
MPNPPGSRTVTFVAIGAVKDEIDRRAAGGLPYGKAALELVEAGLRREVEAPVAAAEKLLLDLAGVPLADLLDELRARVERAAANDELLARAAAAEAKLASIASVVAPGVGA